MVGEGDGDRDALLLAAGESFWDMVEAVSESYEIEEVLGPLLAFLGGEVGEHHGEGDVFDGGQVGEEVAACLLPDEAYFAASVFFDFSSSHAKEVAVADADFACRGGVVSCEDVQQGSFSAAAGADDGDDFSACDDEIESSQRYDFEVGDLVYLEEVSADDIFFRSHGVSSEIHSTRFRPVVGHAATRCGSRAISGRVLSRRIR